MGILGQQTSDVVAGVKKSIQVFAAQGKPDSGANFVLVAADVQQPGAATRGLVEKFITPLEEGK